MPIPLKDSLLVPWSTNVDTRITASASTFGLTSAQATTYTSLHTPYVASYEAMMNARADGTRSQSLTAEKNSTKLALLTFARQIYAFVAANETVSDANKVLLGVHVRGPNGTIPRPGVSPGMDISKVVGRLVTVHIHDSASSAKRGKPSGSTAAWVYSYVGPEYPSDPSEWNFEGATTKPTFAVQFPSTLAGGTQVWICAAWINGKQEAGPVCLPLTTTLQGGGTSSTSLKIAA